jgi:hypothetical protein
MFTPQQMELIKQTTEGSKVWQEINAKVKALYEKHNRIPSDEEYQALRTMIFCKAVLEDKNLMKVMADSTWEALQQ